MPVKGSHSGARVLTVIETVAAQQPIGVRALARLLRDDKSAVQRTLVTLADKGWIRTAREPPVRWELTAHILAIAHLAHGSNDLRHRARPTLERLRDESGETVMLVVPDVTNFVVADVVESRQMLRMVTPIGFTVAVENTATGRAVLPHLDRERQTALLGREPGESFLAMHALARRRGYAVSDGEINPGAASIAAPIIEFDGQAVGAIVVIGPKERLTAAHHDRIGTMLARAARDLSNASIDHQGS